MREARSDVTPGFSRSVMERMGSGYMRPSLLSRLFQFFVFGFYLLEQVDYLYLLRTVGLAVAALEAVLSRVTQFFVLL